MRDERAHIESQIPNDFRLMLPHRVGDVVARAQKGEALFAVITEIRDEERRRARAARQEEPATAAVAAPPVETGADAGIVTVTSPATAAAPRRGRRKGGS